MVIVFSELFDKYAEWKIIKHIITSGEKEFYTNELARKLEMSTATTNKFLKKGADNGLFKKRRIGNVDLYIIDENNKSIRLLQQIIPELIREERKNNKKNHPVKSRRKNHKGGKRSNRRR